MTKVVFRRYNGDILALFPEIPTDNQGLYCLSYMHRDGHAAADYDGCISYTKPATPEEYKDLFDELVQIGYEPQPIKRASYKIHDQRHKNTKEAYNEVDKI